MASVFPFFIAIFIYYYFTASNVTTATAAVGFNDHKFWGSDEEPVTKSDEWRSVVKTEYGKISAVKVSDGSNGSYYLQLITLEPNALFLPVILHADMVFYVHTGSGRVTSTGGQGGGEENGKKHKDKDKDGSKGISIQRGDVYRLQPGTIFYIQSNLENERQKLRIYAIFANSVEDLREPVIGPYSGIRDLVLGFDKKIIQSAFQIPDETVEELTSGSKPPPIVHALQNSSSRKFWEVEAQLLDVVFGRKNYIFSSKKKKSTGVFNILSGDRDVENCNGWSTTVTSKQARPLRGSNIGLFMVNMSKGAMMGPHWNPIATEIAIVLEGQGMVNVVCPGSASGKECKNRRFRVEEGDAFVVPRYHPMAQMAFNNGTFVFMGFTTRNKNNHPQFLAGQRSVLRTVNTKVLAESFGVSKSTVSRLLEPQHDSILLECVSCAEEEERLMEEEIQREKEKEEARKREEERKKEEEEKRKQEEKARKAAEEARRKAEEEARKRAEEEAKKKAEEEARRKEEEEAGKRAEEEARRKEEEEARKRAEEEARRKEEEAARKREEEKERERGKEEARKREEEARRKEEEKRAEEEARRKEEEAARKREEEKEREREKEEARKREEEEARRKEEEKRAEEEARRKEEAARKREEEKEREREKEEARKRAEEEAARKRAEEEAARKREEKERKKQEEARRREEEEEAAQQEEIRRQQEAAREAAAARRAKEEEQAREQKEAREREKEKSQAEEDRGRQQETAKEAAAKRAKEEEQAQAQEKTQGGQEEAEYQPGGAGEGKRRRVLTDMWTV